MSVTSIILSILLLGSVFYSSKAAAETTYSDKKSCSEMSSDSTDQSKKMDKKQNRKISHTKNVSQ